MFPDVETSSSEARAKFLHSEKRCLCCLFCAPPICLWWFFDSFYKVKCVHKSYLCFGQMRRLDEAVWLWRRGPDHVGSMECPVQTHHMTALIRQIMARQTCSSPSCPSGDSPSWSYEGSDTVWLETFTSICLCLSCKTNMFGPQKLVWWKHLHTLVKFPACCRKIILLTWDL